MNTEIDDSDESQEELDGKVKKSNDSSKKVNYSRRTLQKMTGRGRGTRNSFLIYFLQTKE